jgi:hypothetical protein
MFPVFSIQRVKELIEGAGKQREVWEVFVPEASGFDETPDTFNEIKVGGIGWKVKELHVERVCHFHNQSASLVTGIVHHQRNLLSGIRGTDFLQKFADHFRINRSGHHSFADTHSFAIRSNKPPRTEVISNEQ